MKEADAQPFDLEWLKSALKSRGVEAGENPAIQAIVLIDHLRGKLEGNPLAHPEIFFDGEEEDGEVLATVIVEQKHKGEMLMLPEGQIPPKEAGWIQTPLVSLSGAERHTIWTR